MVWVIGLRVKVIVGFGSILKRFPGFLESLFGKNVKLDIWKNVDAFGRVLCLKGQDMRLTEDLFASKTSQTPLNQFIKSLQQMTSITPSNYRKNNLIEINDTFSHQNTN